MATKTIPRTAKKLMSYLKVTNGIDTSEFIDKSGAPDLSGARNYAEQLRIIHKDYLDELVAIEQKFNKVTIQLIP